jgi:ABC-type uncharacterized transport system substrate-binding protein
VLGSGLGVPARYKIPELALKARLPTVFNQSQWVKAGGLMSYGLNFPWMWRRGAEMVAAILRGAKAGDIPIEQPTRASSEGGMVSPSALAVCRLITNSNLVR